MSSDIDIGHNHEAWVRARPGTTLPVLVSRMNQTFIPLVKKYPAWELDRAYEVRPLLDATVGSLGPILVILFAATALLLVLAAVNVTNLILARTTGRTREVAVRSALGASRVRIITQLLTESVLIALLGGLLGSAFAYGVIRFLLQFGASRLPRLESLAMDFHVIAFVAVVAGLTGVLVGLVPAVRMADTEISALMNESGRSVHGSRKTRRLQGHAFNVSEIAVAVAIVAGAGRLVLQPISIWRASIRASVHAGCSHSTSRCRRRRGRPRSGATPGGMTLRPRFVRRARYGAAVAATSSLPLEPHEWDNDIRRPGRVSQCAARTAGECAKASHDPRLL